MLTDWLRLERPGLTDVAILGCAPGSPPTIQTHQKCRRRGGTIRRNISCLSLWHCCGERGDVEYLCGNICAVLGERFTQAVLPSAFGATTATGAGLRYSPSRCLHLVEIRGQQFERDDVASAMRRVKGPP